MDFRQIEIFKTVMVCGTTSRAAEVLRISQPAVSKTIKQLESLIGFSLFNRVKGRLIPSPEGQLFFREVENSFIGLARLRSAAARIHDFGSGDLRIACLSAFSTNLLPQALQKFQHSHPNIAVTLQVSGSSRIRDLVAAGQFDLALTSDEIDTTGVEAIPYAKPRAALALYPGHPLEKMEVVQASDLHELPFVALAPEDTTRREAEAIFSSRDVKPRIVVETGYSSTVCALVLARLGCGIVDPITATGFIERGLILKPLKPAIHFRTLILFPPDRQKSLFVHELVDALIEQKDIADHIIYQ